jgi:hypothetical protein
MLIFQTDLGPRPRTRRPRSGGPGLLQFGQHLHPFTRLRNCHRISSATPLDRAKPRRSHRRGQSLLVAGKCPRVTGQSRESSSVREEAPRNQQRGTSWQQSNVIHVVTFYR